MAALQTLLAPEDPASSGQDRASALSKKIFTATSSLMFIPTLHPLALEVVASGLIYQCSLVDLCISQTPPEGQLGSALRGAWSLLDSLLTHCPHGWSPRLFKWCTGVLGRVCTSTPGPAGLEGALKMWLTCPSLSPVISLLNQCTYHLVSSGRGTECMDVLFPLCSQHTPNLNWLLTHVVSLHPNQLTPLLLDHALSTPSTSDPSLATLTKVFDYLSRTYQNALRRCVVEQVRLLVVVVPGEGGGRDDKGTRFTKLSVLLRIAINCHLLLHIVSEDVLKIVTAGRLMQLLSRETRAMPAGASVAESGDHASVARDSEEEDEGEILSDEEGMEVGGAQENGHKPGMSLEDMVSLWSEVICLLPGKEACRAICVAMDVFTGTKQSLKEQEASIEEGEIVHESAMHHVIKSCQRVMQEVVSRLHSAACTPHLTPGTAAGKGGGAGSGGQDLEFAIGMQKGMGIWCDRILDCLMCKEKSECVVWLKGIVMSVCVSSSELQAARALARLLCHAHSPAQLGTVMSIFASVQARHFYLTRSTIQCALAAIQQATPTSTPSLGPCRQDAAQDKDTPPKSADSGHRSLLLNFSTNMMRILNGTKEEDKPSSSHSVDFHLSLCEQLLPLTQLLVLALPVATSSRDLVTTYNLMRLVLELKSSRSSSQGEGLVGEGACLRPQSQNRMLQALLIHHFSLMKMLGCSLVETGHAHIGLEAALGKSLWLIAWCTSPPPSSHASSPTGDPASSASARIMAYTTIMDNILSKEMGYFSNSDSSHDSSHLCDSASICAELLAANLHMGLNRAGGHSIRKEQGSEVRDSQGKRKNDISFTSSHLTSHLIRLLLAVGSSPSPPPSPSPSSETTANLQQELGEVLLDAVAPQCLGELQQWPDEETLKYSLERDLAIKHMFDENPVLWQCLRLIAERPSITKPSGLIACAPIIRSLLTVLTQHWQRCCVDSTAMFSRELQYSTFLVEVMATAGWVGPPLAYIGELFCKASPHEIGLLLAALNTHLKILDAVSSLKEF